MCIFLSIYITIYLYKQINLHMLIFSHIFNIYIYICVFLKTEIHVICKDASAKTKRIDIYFFVYVKWNIHN